MTTPENTAEARSAQPPPAERPGDSAAKALAGKLADDLFDSQALLLALHGQIADLVSSDVLDEDLGGMIRRVLRVAMDRIEASGTVLMDAAVTVRDAA